jgi:hypothetical protein
MKFLIINSYAPAQTKEIKARMKQWKQKGKYKLLYPLSGMVGRNKSFWIAECDDIAELYKDTSQWQDLETFEIIPVEDVEVLQKKVPQW